VRVLILCLLGLLVLGAGQATANWAEPSPGVLDADPSHEGESANIANVGGTPYVVWDEDDGAFHYQARVKRLEAGGWAPVGGSLNADTSRNAFWEDIASVGGVPYVVWAEDAGSASYRVHVKRLEAGSWTALGGVQNVSPTADANSTTIADVGGVPYIAWHEEDGVGHYQVRVKRLEGGAFVSVGGSLNISATRNGSEPVVAGIGGVPYVVWRESDGTHDLVRVKRLEGSTWVSVGDPLNPTQTQSYAPSITGIGGVPYVAWSGEDGTTQALNVVRLDGSAWQPVGDPLNTDPSHYSSAPNIADVGGVPIVTWSEDTATNYLVYAKRFDGAAWSMLGANPLNIDPSFSASEPETVSIGGVPYVAFDEYDSISAKKIRVRRLEPDVGAEAATPTATGATLTAQVNDFGLALPVGFEYGTTSAFGTATPLQSTSGAGASTVTQDIAGLAPQTSYSFRAFGSDGARQTSLGTTQAFTTLAAGGGGVPPPGVPVISNLTLTPAAFVAKKGTRVSYDDSSAATTTFTVQRPTAGRRKGGKCVQSRKRPPKSRRCTRYVKLGSFKHADTAGRNSFRFKGRVGGRKLKPGAYRLRAVARNSAGAGKAVTKRFRVKRR
jgi:hypothetical protein